MRTPAYSRCEHEHFFISESSPLEEYEPEPSPAEWSDDEIAAIRAVLQRLTALRVRNSMDAEDLVQDTLLTMITKYPESELEKGPLIWSMGILRKKVGNYYRKAQRAVWIEKQRANGWPRDGQAMRAACPEKQFAYEELQKLVEKTLIRLPVAQREPLELLIAGHNAGEIAEQLYPERYQNVINYLYRARKKIAKELARYGYGPNPKKRLLVKKPNGLNRR